MICLATRQHVEFACDMHSPVQLSRERCSHYFGVIPQSGSTWWPHCVLQVLNWPKPKHGGRERERDREKRPSDPAKVSDVSKDVPRVG